MSLRETYRRIKALAESGATESERATAADILTKIRAKLGDEDPEVVEAAEVAAVHRHRTPIEEACVMHVAQYLGLRPFYELAPDGWKRTDRTRLVGPEHLVVLAPELIARHAKAARRLVELTQAAYFLGAMPLPRSAEPRRIGPEPESTTSDEERRIILAALEAGRSGALPGLPQST